MLMVLAMDTREGPDPEDEAEFLMAATGHLLEDLMATYHPPGIPDVVTSGPTTALDDFTSSVFMTLGAADPH